MTSDYKLSGIKSHDYHVLLQFILRIVIQGTLSREIREGIYWLATFLRWICGKSMITEEILFWKVEIVEIVCLFETCTPRHFFNIMPHLMIHLPEEVELGDPMHSRWLYFLERYMKLWNQWSVNKIILKVAWVKDTCPKSHYFILEKCSRGWIPSRDKFGMKTWCQSQTKWFCPKHARRKSWIATPTNK